MRIVCTGAGGFIGSHLVEKLIGEGHEVHCILRYNSTGNIGNLIYIKDITQKAKLHFCDLRDTDHFRNIVKGVGSVDIIYHLAASNSVPYSFDATDFVMENNIKSTMSVLKVCNEFKIPRCIVMSTSEVYGTCYEMIKETNHYYAQSVYAASKIAMEKLVEAYSGYANNETQFTVVRGFNTYGDRQSLRAIVPWIMYQAIKGNEITLGGENSARDLIHVYDMVKALYLVGNSHNSSVFFTYNIGSGVTLKIAEIMELIGESTEKGLKVKYQGALHRNCKFKDVEYLNADNSLFFNMFDFKADVGIKMGLLLLKNFIVSNLDRYDVEYDLIMNHGWK